MSPKFFYVICRDGQILEVKFKQETFEAVFNAMLNKGVVMLKEAGIVLNGVDISKVLNEDQYGSFLDSVDPKKYILNGAWYTRDNHNKPYGYEQWRKEEIEEVKKIGEKKKEECTPEEIKKLIEYYRPAFLKQVKN
jgi:tRNA splicing endonuclease